MAILGANCFPIKGRWLLFFIDAVQLIEGKKILDLPAVDNGKLVGLLSLHSAIKIFIEG
jgi:hypothetical protein